MTYIIFWRVAKRLKLQTGLSLALAGFSLTSQPAGPPEVFGPGAAHASYPPLAVSSAGFAPSSGGSAPLQPQAASFGPAGTSDDFLLGSGLAASAYNQIFDLGAGLPSAKRSGDAHHEDDDDEEEEEEEEDEEEDDEAGVFTKEKESRLNETLKRPPSVMEKKKNLSL
ncbi:MAG: hypothetical protein AAGK05_18145 [Pseudomonadota bacterium]